MPTWIMRLRVLALVAATVAAPAAQAAELASRHGLVQALPASESTFTVTFAGKPLATLEATQVSLSRVTPRGPQEHIVIESWKPGLHCHKAYVLLTIRPDRTSSVSPSFGECAEIQAASYLKDGVRVILRDSHPPGARHPRLLAYTWAGGQLSRSPAQGEQDALK